MRFWSYIKQLLCSVLLIGMVLGTGIAHAKDNAKTKAATWPQNSSDLKPDPGIKFGVLANGMRYAIMHSNTPANAVSLRFVIDAGSLQENDAQQGIAHLLEHMAFRGSKQVPDGEVVKTLERIGLQFGADTNASTSHTKTVYKFDLPNGNDANVDTALMLLREIASELNITDAALKTERGVVLSEFRLRYTAEERAEENEFGLLMHGMRAPTRWTIGKTDILEKADAKLVRSFYDSYYHPERATLIVTGNIDPQAIEKEITTRFGNWQRAKHSITDPALGHVTRSADNIQTYVEPGLPTNISLDWISDYNASANQRSDEQQQLIRSIGLAALNHRFEQAALSSDAPFTAAQAGSFDNLFRSIRGASVSINTTSENWQASLQSAQHILNNALTQGLTKEEVDHVVAMIRTSLQTAIAGANTRRTQALAEELVASLENNEVFLSPQQSAAMAEPVLANLQASAVTTALRNALTGTNSLVYLTNSAAIDGGAATLAKVYNQAVSDHSTDSQAQHVTTWPYSKFGEPGKVVHQQKLDDQDATFVKFANGVTLAIKHTDFTAGQAEVTVKVGDGRLALDKTKSNAAFLLDALISGGLDAIDFPTMQQVLAGKTYKAEASLNDNFVLLHGVTTPEDLDTQLQVLTAYVTAPALRSGAIEQMRNSYSDYLRQIEAQPLYYLRNQSRSLLRSGDSRWAFPTTEQIKDAKRDDLLAWLLPQLKQGSIQVNIVGDINLEKAIAATAATFGALPARAAATLKVSPTNEVKFPAPTDKAITLHHSGRKDQAQVMIAWPAPDRRSSLDEVADLQMLAAIVNSRLLDAMRSRTGSSYTANSNYDGSWSFTGYGNIVASADMKPDQTQVFYDAINSIIDDLHKAPVSADEFSRAQLPLLSTIEKQEQTNGFYAQLLISPDIDPLYSEWIRKLPAYIKAVTPERVQAVAKKYLLQNKAWKAIMVPQESASTEAK